MAEQKALSITQATVLENDEPSQVASSNNKYFLCRVILNRTYAAGPFLIRTTKATTTKTLLNIVRRVVPRAVVHAALKGKPTTKFIFNLQESCAEKPYCDYVWTTVTTATSKENATGYAQWYERNVVNGDKDKLKVEVHVLAKGKAGDEDHETFERELREAGEGKGVAESADAPYIRLKGRLIVTEESDVKHSA